jgi:hypothetical protein
MSLIASGLVESTARCGMKRSSQATAGFLATVVWTTKVASTGKKSPSSSPSRNDS